MKVPGVEDIRAQFHTRARLMDAAEAVAPAVAAAARELIRCLEAGGTVFACGNGGSATQSTHFVAELVGRFKRERNPFRAYSLNENTATLTAVPNDYEFADVFARQVRGLARAGDVLLAISTSGKSINVARACNVAREQGARVIALTGAAGGPVAEAADVAVCVPDGDTPCVQEVHLVVIHLLCGIVEDAMAGDPGGRTP
ncbi:MAG TPA: SIS domain-containing protein [Candidatus Krumholzibacteria bacterium]|nr:SIS domain-containing protein [Candidatus Krumholzibacteria bacterium]